ncbi:SDR family NAD(P)-dependent oxidoreductase [Antrihabitans cavernicola]|uniref:SDR family oxidoreductase n=1 Tax=Antrihabitans cavernicola TaxID=2495913 RepID=A0A5A7S6A8_9NOCA|nr:SDR family NAD(P)-dependent oxidoreductase [Spelaeibacter cavernicola]KAA0021650.1 SDR family oxidoreductase [Spelaeibacter cavernicola]
MTTTLTGRTALITGGGVGIGRSIAQHFAEAGARVAVTYRTHEPDSTFHDAIVAAGGHPPLAFAVDATDPTQVRATADNVAGEFGGLDILVNNVGGLVQRAGLADLDLDLWHTILQVNLDSTFLFSHYVLPHLRPGTGRIINVASLAGHTGGHPGALAYATAKAAIFGFTRSLAKELAPQHITVNALAPGFIEATPFHDTFTTASSKAATIDTIPAGRAGNPDDVAGPALWLASDLSAYVTGTITDINGGQYFH